MLKPYTVSPLNFDEINSYVLVDKLKITQEILIADTCYFYDACAFRKHIYMKRPENLFEFIKKNKGIVIIIRSIIMELASHGGMLNIEYIKYIQKMQEAGIKVLILYEEDLFEILSQCFTTNIVINDFLSWAIKTVKRPTSTITETLNADKKLLNDIVKGNSKGGFLFNSFFQAVRSNKESGDNLGEELISICVHVLSNIPNTKSYKYVVLTEDRGAIRLINKVSKNIYEYIGKYTISALTTVKITQRLYEEEIISSKDQVEEILSIGMVGNIIKILGSEEYDLEMKEKTMTCCELAEKIVTPNAIHINY